MNITDQPLVSALLELDEALKGKIALCIGGGLGLFLKQLYLQNNPQIKTLFPLHELPTARTTEDIDLFLRADVVTNPEQMRTIRAVLDCLGYQVVESAKYMQFTKPLAPGYVKIDLLAGPLGEFASRVQNDPRRVRPRPSVNLHARKVDEAIGIEDSPIQISLSGALPSGNRHETIIRVPQAFTYLLMKIMAFGDRLNDDDKDLGRHHALDLYRIVGLLTQDEEASVRRLSLQFSEHVVVLKARELIHKYFAPERGMGRIRIREHRLARTASLDLDRFVDELGLLMSPESQALASGPTS